MVKVHSAVDGDDDSAEILARRAALLQRFRRGAIAATGVVLSANACACLSMNAPCTASDAGPDGGLVGCAEDQLPDGGTKDGG